MLIGAHVSIAGGMDKSIDRATAIGANAIQTFASSPRTLSFKEIEAGIIDEYKFKREQADIKFHVFHGVYLINLATDNKKLLELAVESLKFYQQLSCKMGGVGTIFHVGSHKGKGFGTVLDQVGRAVVEVLKNTPEGVKLILENAAGSGGVIGQSFEELDQIIEWVKKSGNDTGKLGICLDTQHAFASGYDLKTEEGVDKMVDDIDVNRVVCIHANDSAMLMGSKKDRHANIGEGLIGEGGFKILTHHHSLRDLPFILEVPGDNKSGPRGEDVQKLKEIYQG